MTRLRLNLVLEAPGGLLPYSVDEASLVQAAVGQPLPPVQPKSFAAPGVDRNDPACAGWLLIVADDVEGRAIAAALAPLVEHRLRLRNDSSDDPYWPHPEAAVKFFPIAGAEPTALAKWVETHIAFAGGVDSPPPDYVLIAGSPAKIPFELDYRVQARQQLVGRLDFPELASYRDYAAKIIAWEPDDDYRMLSRNASFRNDLPVVVFAPDWGHNDPTSESRAQLAEPLVARLKKPRPLSKNITLPASPVTSLIAEDASRAALLSALRGDAPALAGPRLLFSASHGLAVPGRGAKTRARRLLRQGAISCQDARIMGEQEILAAEDLGAGALLQGGIWVMFACFGGGTPQSSEFFAALDDPQLLGLNEGGPFVAALPTRLLANPDGPLAVLAHLDPSFSHAFSRPDGEKGGRQSAILTITDWLLRGARIGVAMSAVLAGTNMFRDEVMQVRKAAREELGGLVSEAEVAAALATAPADSRLAQLRHQLVDGMVSLHDYRNFLILGDPAAKLPRARARPQGATTGVPAPAPPATTTPLAVGDAAVPCATTDTLPAFVAEAYRDQRLRFTCSDDLFAPAGVSLPAGERIVVALRAEPCADVRRRPAEQEERDGTKSPFYESIEHQDCDLTAVVRFSATEAYAAPSYRLALSNRAQLRYGELISLSGDFFGIPGTQVAAGEAAFRAIFKTLDEGNPAELGRILTVMASERVAVDAALAEQRSVVDAYGLVVDDLNNKYNAATGGGSFITQLWPMGRYLKLAAVNFDHFGGDAVAAYRVAHGVACAEALGARAESSAAAQRHRLTQAYAMNACADHFLTDLFASGHLRVPRRALAEQIAIKLAGDLLSKRMHDEDNARGLNVRNRRGDTWKTYGDKHFHSAENAKGRELAREAVRRSAEELWLTFATGTTPAFAALDVTPDLADVLTRRDNHAPLFIVENKLLKRRARLDDTTCFEWTADFNGVGTLLRGAVDSAVGKHTH